MNISTTSWQHIIEAIKNNQYTHSCLDLHDFNLHDLEVSELTQALKSNEYITSLDLANNNISALGELANNTKLTTLNLSHNHIKNTDLQALADNNTLTYLDISDNNIGNIGAKALAHNSHLLYLDVNNNGLGVRSAIEFAENNTLQTLKIGSNHIGDEGLLELLANKNLTNLDVSANGLTALSMTELGANHILTSLNVSNNSISSAGILELVKNTTLTDLNIGGNFFNETVLNSLGENNTLISLNLSHNLMTTGQAYIKDFIGWGIGYTYGHTANYSSYLPITKIPTLAHLDLSFNTGFLLNTDILKSFIKMSSLETFNVEHSGFYKTDIGPGIALDHNNLEYSDMAIQSLFLENPKLNVYFNTADYITHSAIESTALNAAVHEPSLGG